MHHAWARAIRKEVLFLDDRDRRLYLRLLEGAVEQYGWLCLGYCLMTNHLHLLIETPEPNLGRGMQWLHGHFGRHCAKRADRAGHAFDARYGSKRIKDDAQLWTVVPYIARNPAEAKLCERPSDWEWSSHRGIVDGTSPAWVARARLLGYYEGLGGVPLERYAASVG